MKNIILIVIFLIVNLITFAQKVRLKDETIWVDGNSYAYLKNREGDFCIQTLDYKNVIYVRAVGKERSMIEFYELIFLDSGKKAQLENEFQFATLLAQKLVRFKVLTENGINPNGMRQFLETYNENLENRNPNNTQEKKHEHKDHQNIVERNTSSTIYVFGNTIKQDFKDIATYKKEISAITGVKIEFYFPNGELCARVLFAELFSKECTITTTIDHKQYRLEAKDDEIEKIVKFLIERLYL